MIYDGIFICYFAQICNRVMALDKCQIFVSAQYFENKWIEFTKFLYALILTRSRLGLLPVIFRKFVKELGPLIDVRISFQLNIY